MEQYQVTGMSCAACSARVEKAVSRVPGVTSCSVSLLTNSMAVEGTADEAAIVAAVTEAGYGAKRKGAEPPAARPPAAPGAPGEPGRFLASAIAFILNYAFYFSEIFRAGIEGVPKGQQEAAQVLGLTGPQTFFHVTLLQMVKRIVPPLSNEVITLVKDTSIARIISMQELIYSGYAFLKGSHGYSGLLWPIFFTGVYYLAFNGILTLLFGRIEKRLQYFS